MYCPSWCRNSTYQCGDANYPVSWGWYRDKNGNRETSGLPIPMAPGFHRSNVYIKGKLRVWRAQKCIAIVCAKTPPTCAGLQITSFHGWQYRAENGIMRNFGPTNPHATAFPPKQWLYQKEATGMESSKMYCPSWCRHSTYQCGAAQYPFLWGTV